MASIRIGIASEFNLVDSKVGIGTTNPKEFIDIRGQVDSDNSLGAGGISTVTTYQGFVDTKQVLRQSTSKGTVVANTLSGEVCIDGPGGSYEVNVSSGTTYTSGFNELTSTNKFTLPKIGNSRPTEGTLRFNDQIGALEFHTGLEWRAVNSYVDSGNRGRAVFAGGGSPLESPGAVPYMSGKIIDYIQIASIGNAQGFGDLTQFSRHTTGLSNHIRGVIYHGSATPGNNNVLDKITIASQGNASSFGLIDGTDTYGKAGASSSTRGIFAGGSPGIDDIDYIEINQDGNSKDFGDLSTARTAAQSCCDGRRAVIAGGRNPGGLSDIESFNIASKGNSSGNFGELTSLRCNGFGFSNSTRGVFGAGKDGPNYITRGLMESLIIASGGNAIEFGDCYAGGYVSGGASQTRGIIAGGIASSSPNPKLNTIQYITIASSGNATDFGDLTRPCYDPAGLTDSHGGLGGF